MRSSSNSKSPRALQVRLMCRTHPVEAMCMCDHDLLLSSQYFSAYTVYSFTLRGQVQAITAAWGQHAQAKDYTTLLTQPGRSCTMNGCARPSPDDSNHSA
eukprot:13734232-Alexandrium_andersonii.AAC.1